MDITVYLPDRLGELAKQEGLNLSRLLRDAASKELEARGVTWDSGFVSVDESTALIKEALSDGQWHRRRDLGEALGDKVPDAHFGHARRALSIELRRLGGGPGTYSEWRLPTEGKEADDDAS